MKEKNQILYNIKTFEIQKKTQIQVHFVEKEKKTTYNNCHLVKKIKNI